MIGNNSCGVHSLTDRPDLGQRRGAGDPHLRRPAPAGRRDAGAGDRPHHPRGRAARRDLPPPARAARPLRRPDPRALPAAPAAGLRLQPRRPAARERLPRRPRARRHRGDLRQLPRGHRPPGRRRRRSACCWCSAIRTSCAPPRRVPEVLAAGTDRPRGDGPLPGRQRAHPPLLPRDARPAPAGGRLAAGRVRRRDAGRGRRSGRVPLDLGLERAADGVSATSRRGSGRCARPRWRRRRAIRGSATAGRAGRTRRCAPERFGAYLRDLRALLDQHGYRAAFYGHFGQGCIHTRIDFDFRLADGDPARTATFLDEAADLVVSLRRLALGRARRRPAARRAPAPDVRRRAGPGLPRVQGDLGPGQPMNPGKMVDPYPLDAEPPTRRSASPIRQPHLQVPRRSRRASPAP